MLVSCERGEGREEYQGVERWKGVFKIGSVEVTWQ